MTLTFLFRAPSFFLNNCQSRCQILRVDLNTMAPLATVGILSIGDMGMGIAKLLIARNYRVVTTLEGRRYLISIALYCDYCSGLKSKAPFVPLLLQCFKMLQMKIFCCMHSPST
jgi:hypothetical protein